MCTSLLIGLPSLRIAEDKNHLLTHFVTEVHLLYAGTAHKTFTLNLQSVALREVNSCTE